MNKNIEITLRSLFNEVSNRNIRDISKDIREFGIDSLQFITFAARIEEEFNFEFDFDDLDNINPFSINNITNFILGKGVK